VNARARLAHPDWCAQDHTCTAGHRTGEHRARPINLRVPGAGSVVLTRVRSHERGTQHAEIRLSITLPEAEPDARARLTALLSHLRVLIGPPRAPQRPGAGVVSPAAGRAA
jgi:hypothetical protein